jgi:hypothetical protein
MLSALIASLAALLVWAAFLMFLALAQVAFEHAGEKLRWVSDKERERRQAAALRDWERLLPAFGPNLCDRGRNVRNAANPAIAWSARV